MSLLEKMEAPLKILPRWCLSDVIFVFNQTLSEAQLVPMEHGRSWFWFLPGPLRVVGLIILVCRCVSVTYVGVEFCRDKAYILVWRDWSRAQKSQEKKWPRDQLSIRLQHGLWLGDFYQARVTASLGRHRALRAGLGFWWRGLFVFSQLLKPGSVF